MRVFNTIVDTCFQTCTNNFALKRLDYKARPNVDSSCTLALIGGTALLGAEVSQSHTHVVALQEEACVNSCTDKFIAATKRMQFRLQQAKARQHSWPNSRAKARRKPRT